MLSLGIKGEQLYTVQLKDTSKAMNTGGLEVLSFPSMITLMESTVCSSIEPYLEKGTTTVGKSISANHLSPTPIGTTIRCESELIKIDGKELTFTITAHDNFGIIGTCIHERTIVDSQYLMMKAMVKKASN